MIGRIYLLIICLLSLCLPSSVYAHDMSGIFYFVSFTGMGIVWLIVRLIMSWKPNWPPLIFGVITTVYVAFNPLILFVGWGKYTLQTFFVGYCFYASCLRYLYKNRNLKSVLLGAAVAGVPYLFLLFMSLMSLKIWETGVYNWFSFNAPGVSGIYHANDNAILHGQIIAAILAFLPYILVPKCIALVDKHLAAKR